MSTKVRLEQTPVHLGKDESGGSTALPLQGFGYRPADFESYIEQHCRHDPGRLLMQETSHQHWTHWECHPAGHEIVIVVAGRGTFYQQQDGQQIAIPVQQGDVIINGPGIWHTADIDEALTAIYLTPCPETRHKPR